MNHQLLSQLEQMAAARGMAPAFGVCDTHGNFEGFAPAGGVPNCPVCMDLKAKTESQQRALGDRVAAIRKIIGVPARFAKSGFREWEPANDSAKTVLSLVMQYFREARESQKAWRPLLLSGAPGTGKTHLLCALTNNLAEAAVGARYTTLQNMLADIKSAYSDNTKTEAGQTLRWVQVDFLAIDEVDVMRASDNDLMLLFGVINGRYNELKPTAVASNQPVADLSKFVSERVVDRLRENAVTLHCDWNSVRSESSPTNSKPQ